MYKTFKTPNFTYIVNDIVNCIKSQPSKRLKRINRLRFLYAASFDERCPFNLDDNLKDEIEYILSYSHKFPEKDLDIKDDKVLDMICKVKTEFPEFSSIDSEEKGDELLVKQYIESFLTKELNSDEICYNAACEVFGMICNDLEKDKIIGPLIRCNRVVPYLKGGMAARLYLLQVLPEEYHDQVRGLFGNGDNDTGIIIDPSLNESEFKAVFARIRLLVHISMDKYRSFVSKHSKVSKKIRSINKVAIGNLLFDVTHVSGHDFYAIGDASDNEKPTLVHNYELEYGVVITTNMIHSFNELGDICCFHLSRYKIPFGIQYLRDFKAEFLDISISGWEDHSNKKFEWCCNNLSNVRVELRSISDVLSDLQSN